MDGNLICGRIRHFIIMRGVEVFSMLIRVRLGYYNMRRGKIYHILRVLENNRFAPNPVYPHHN